MGNLRRAVTVLLLLGLTYHFVILIESLMFMRAGGGYDAPGRSPRVVRLPPLSSTSSSRVVPWGGGGGTSRTATGGPGDQASSTSKAGSPSPSTTSTTMRTLLGFTRTADGYTTQTRLAGPLDVWALGE